MSDATITMRPGGARTTATPPLTSTLSGSGPQTPGARPGPTLLHALLSICDGGEGLLLPHQNFHGGRVTYDIFVGWHSSPLFLLENGTWVASGTIRIDLQAGAETPDEGIRWGSFAIRGASIGDFDGTWAWAQGNGYGAGTSISPSSLGTLIGITFHGEDVDTLPPPPPDPCHPEAITGPTKRPMHRHLTLVIS